MRTVKIIQVNPNVTHIFYIGTCDKCKKEILVPEPHYAWYIRAVGREPHFFLHPACGGKEMRDDYHVSAWWGGEYLDSAAGDNSRTVTKVDTPNCTVITQKDYFNWGKQSRGVYVNAFSVAHNALRKFIVNPVTATEVVDEQRDKHGPVEQSQQHGPQVYETS